MSDITIDSNVGAPDGGGGQPPSNGPTPAENPEELLDFLNKDFEKKKNQKARPTGGVEGTTLENLCFVNDEQYVSYKNKTLSLEPKDQNKLYLSFNLVGPRVDKLTGRLSAFEAPFKARPNKKDPQALEDGEACDRMLIALDEKLDEPSLMRERLFWILVGGTCFEYTPWIPNATIEPMPQFDDLGNLLYRDLHNPDPQAPPVPEPIMQQMVLSGRAPEEFEIYEEVQMTGDVGGIILSPFNVFVDSSVKSIRDLAPDQWVHIALPKTVGWVKENYGEEVEPQSEISLVQSKIDPTSGDSTGGTYLKDLIPLVQGSCGDDDPPMVLHVESFQPPSKDHPKGRYICWIPKQKILHEADNPYEEIPLTDFHFSAVTTSFWTKAYVTRLIAGQRFINKRLSQLGEQANSTLYSSLLLGNGITASQIPADFPGAIENGLNENGTPAVGRVPPPEIPQWFLQSIEMVVKMFNDAAGGADLMEETKFPGQLRGPQAVPMLQEIIDTQWRPLFNHLAERLSRTKQMRLNRVKQFYPPMRTLHYTGKDMQDEVLTFHAEKVLRSGTNFNVTVERGAILPELRALREARLTERLRGPLMVLYIDERTGKLDKSKIAADLQFGDIGREGRESQYRKLSQEIIKMLWEAKPVPPVQPFYDHKAMLDELENAMATTEYLKASPKVQALFSQRWTEHETFLRQEAMAQQQAMMGQQIHSAVAQATQQAAAMAASDAVHETQNQLHAQSQQPTGQYVAQAEAQASGGPPSGPKKPQNGPSEPPNKKSRKITYEEKS